MVVSTFSGRVLQRLLVTVVRSVLGDQDEIGRRDVGERICTPARCEFDGELGERTWAAPMSQGSTRR